MLARLYLENAKKGDEMFKITTLHKICSSSYFTKLKQSGGPTRGVFEQSMLFIHLVSENKNAVGNVPRKSLDNLEIPCSGHLKRDYAIQ